METWTLKLAVIDWIALALLIGGYFYGLNKGLGAIFGMMLWLIAAMWVGRVLAPSLLEWMPNTSEAAGNWHSQFLAYGGITGTLLVLPLMGKILTRRSQRKEKSAEPQSKHFGSLVGAAAAGLFFRAHVMTFYYKIFPGKAKSSSAKPAGDQPEDAN